MHFFHFLWYDVLYRPVYNLVIFTYQTLPGHDMGLAIIYLAVLVRIILLPASLAGSTAARRIEELRPQLDQLARMPEAGRRKERMRQLLRRNKVNVYATALVLAAQVLFLGLLYQVFQSGLHHDPSQLAYFEVETPIDTTFFGLFDLAAKNWWLPLITGGALYALLSLTTPEPEPGAKLSDVWYVIALPVFMVVILLFLPSAKSLFLLTSILFSVALYFVAKLIFRVEPPNLAQDTE
jgi:membrane protein insertase Oxa1/YidC/SpoIIIJ